MHRDAAGGLVYRRYLLVLYVAAVIRQPVDGSQRVGPIIASTPSMKNYHGY